MAVRTPRTHELGFVHKLTHSDYRHYRCIWRSRLLCHYGNGSLANPARLFHLVAVYIYTSLTIYWITVTVNFRRGARVALPTRKSGKSIYRKYRGRGKPARWEAGDGSIWIVSTCHHLKQFITCPSRLLRVDFNYELIENQYFLESKAAVLEYKFVESVRRPIHCLRWTFPFCLFYQF